MPRIGPVVLALFAVVVPATAQPTPAERMKRPGPWDNDLIVYRVAAGQEPEKLATFDRAGVPTVARLKDGRLIAAHQHFPADDEKDFDKVAMRLSDDEGKTWTQPATMTLTGLPEGMRFPFDPTLVPLPDGKVRLYFTSNKLRERGSIPAIHSAISSDGLKYEYEPGVRFEVEGHAVIDCAVVLHKSTFHMFVPDNGTGVPGREAGTRPREGVGYHATSQDGLKFERLADVKMPERRRWLGNAVSDGEVIRFFGTGESVWVGESADGNDWKAVEFPRVRGGDPGAVKLKDGAWLIVITGSPRPGTPSAERRKDGPKERPPENTGTIRVTKLDSQYAVREKPKAGTFSTGQPAAVMLGGVGFNNTGGSLLFNHPSGLASDGRCLLVCDRNNNRVLVWKGAPAKNSPPDFVLGQPDFTANNPGTGKHQLNWPGNAAISPAGNLIAVADTTNDRVLIWKSFPAKNAPAADIVLDLPRLGRNQLPYGWPWGVWTDGTRLAVVATHGRSVLIWNAIPTADNQKPDLVLTPEGAGTPRNITSDGTFFALSDHNFGDNSRPATMVWNSFPTKSDQPYDFTWSEWLKGTVTADKQLWLGGLGSIYHWKKLPAKFADDADQRLQPASYRNGDGPDIALANGRLYACNYNGNNVLAWNATPTGERTPPDFALGSDTPGENTLLTNFFITNPVLATDGTSLFASSDFDRRLLVWKKLPNESAAKPDLVYDLPEGPWDNALHNGRLALAGRHTAYLWKKLPLAGEQPDVTFRGNIGSVRLQELVGVALDDKHFYLADRQAGCVYVWEGIPETGADPKYTLEVRSPGRLCSDGVHFAVAPFEGQSIQIYSVADLKAPPQTLGGRGRFNLPSQCLLSGGRCFVADRSFHRVHAWNKLDDALAGRAANAILCQPDDASRRAAIGPDRLFMPGSVAFDGASLWVGEFKFSGRVLRFDPK